MLLYIQTILRAIPDFGETNYIRVYSLKYWTLFAKSLRDSIIVD